MKCEKCNEREANFFYTATINGETTQRHLCAECAREEGFGNAFDWNPSSMFDSFFREPFGMFDDFFSGRSLLGSLMAPAMTMPRLRIAQPQAETRTEEAATKIPTDAGEEVKAKRELNSLKHQLKAAVREENFERAIELRDKIKELEKK